MPLSLHSSLTNPLVRPRPLVYPPVRFLTAAAVRSSCAGGRFGEPDPIWAFLGSGRLATPIGAHRPDVVPPRGRPHRGSFAGAVGDVPVRNVAVHVTGEEFAFFDL